MNNFDELIKSKAKAEKIYVPAGFCERIDSMTENMRKKNVRKIRKVPAAWVAVVLLLVITPVIVFASPIIVNMTEGAISYFSAPKEFRYMSKQAEYEKYNAKVGISCEDNGITITLDNIAVDDNYINVFYTLKSMEPIELRGSEDTPLNWRLRFTAPVFWYKADGRYIEPAAQIETDAYLVDQYTMKGMQRFALLDQLSDNFNLEMYTDEVLNTQGRWHIAVNVDKGNVAVESTTVMPNLRATVKTGWDGTYTHHVTVKKVSVSPFGSQIVLSERGDNNLDNFAIRDDQGNYLPVIPAAVHSSHIFKMDNSFEFIPRSRNMKSITLIPIMTDGHSELKYFDLKNTLPAILPVNELGSYVLESFQMDDEKMVAVLHQDGPVPIINFQVIPSEANGELLHYYVSHIDQEYDRETGTITFTGYWADDLTQEDLDKIAGLSYFANYDFKLNEAEAITIKLN